jgi:hypothetical protein
MITFPYGNSNFHKIRTSGMLYLDRTWAIPALESAAEQLVFLRPRRFGKSLLLSTLANYYDINTASEFETLFGGLAVGNNPTPEHNQYLILRWDFSKVSGQGNIEQIKQNLFEHINTAMREFVEKYRSILTTTPTIIADNGIASFDSLAGVVKNSGHTIYLLIDEYDNFANEVLVHDAGNTRRYYDLLESEGIVKTLFKVVKGSVSEGKISRVFITGVSPLVLSDIRTYALTDVVILWKKKF